MMSSILILSNLTTHASSENIADSCAFFKYRRKWYNYTGIKNWKTMLWDGQLIIFSVCRGALSSFNNIITWKPLVLKCSTHNFILMLPEVSTQNLLHSTDLKGLRILWLHCNLQKRVHLLAFTDFEKWRSVKRWTWVNKSYDIYFIIYL